MGRRRLASKDSGSSTDDNVIIQQHQNNNNNNLDSDLEALLGTDVAITTNNNRNPIVRTNSWDSHSSIGANSATAELNLDHLTNRKIEITTSGKKRRQRKQQQQQQTNSPTSTRIYNNNKGNSNYYYNNNRVGCIEYTCSYITMMCYYYPKCCGCLLIISVLTIMIFLASYIWNPIEEYGHIEHDHSNIKSKYDLSIKDIDHWCLGGGDEDCACEDPLTPSARVEYRSWVEAFKANRKMLKRFEDPNQGDFLDVVFLGESIVEEMDGRWMGRSDRSPGLRILEKTFNKHFHRADGGNYEGIALGIAGDTAPNILWRLLHGELPDYLQPKVWWLSLGNNDLGRMQCSEEVVVLGILRVVEEILDKRPKAHIVINSILPMTDMRGGLYPVISDYEDSFIRIGGGSNRALQFFRSAGKKSMTEEEEAEEVEKEEEARDKKAKKEHEYMKRLPYDKRNPVMFDRDKVKKYKMQPMLRKKNEKPLWTSIRAINKELLKFAEKHDQVTYFDSTDVFVEKIDKRSILLTDRISMRGHPTVTGFQMWQDAVVIKLNKIIEKMKREQPELFPDRKPPPPQETNEDEQEGEVRLDNNISEDDLDDEMLHPNDDGFGFDYRNKMNNNNNNDDDDEYSSDQELEVVTRTHNEPNIDDDDDTI